MLDVVCDIARAGNRAAGARAVHHAARELLAEAFGELAADGPRRQVAISAGPPLAVRVVEAARTPRASPETG